MCNVTELKRKETEMESYLEYVNTEIDKFLRFEVGVYVAYAAHRNKNIVEIGDWFREAETNLVSVHSPDIYLAKKYDVWEDDELDYYYEKEVQRDGTLFECGGYYFKQD